jgi:hypothetical protein
VDEINAADVGQLLRSRMGLLIGPAITKFPDSFTELRDELAKRGEVQPEGTYISTAEVLIEKGVGDSQIRDWVREIVAAQRQSSVLSHLAKPRWAAVLSASLDGHFVDAFQQESSRHVSRQQVTVLGDLLTPPPPRTVPVYKLLGAVTRDGFACSTVTYLERRATWRHAVKGFADLVKGNPVLCLGMSDCPWLLMDLAVEMIGDRTTAPSALLILAGDPVAENTQLRLLLRRRARVVTVRGTVGDVARSVTTAAKSRYARALPIADSDADGFDKLRPFDDILAVVNEQLQPSLAADEQNQLQDLLFSPAVSRWDPYAYNLDFQRSAKDNFLAEVGRALLDADPGGVACAIRGAAVTGKTVLLKRIAWELAGSNTLVLWLKPWAYQDSPRVLRDLFGSVAGLDAWEGKRVVVVMDDPLGFGSMSPKEVVTAARSAGVRIVLLVAVRTSEWSTGNHAEMVGNLPVVGECELSDALDDAEWGRLPDYLVSLNTTSNRSAAEAALIGVKSRAAQDTLSMLFWLLPQTRAHIASSVRDEYHRLGDVAGLARVILKTAQGGTEILKRAYEMVAVADRYHGCLPMEVLVTALNIDYQEWRDSTGADSAAWGLLYSQESPDGTVWYRTRNEIVTRLIVDTLNGGTLVHSGEVRVLTELLRACGGRSSSVYREFCVRVLVPHEKLAALGYEEGLQLYDVALEALSLPDKTLVHQKGLWVKDKGQDAAAARKVLEQALSTPVYPYAIRGEANEHIHTSLAATVLQQINQKSVGVEEGKSLILDHLAKARSRMFFNAQAVHVQANTICKLADKVSDPKSPDYIALINQAVADVDHTLVLLQTPSTGSARSSHDVQMLEQVRDEVWVKVGSPDELKEQAERLWTDFRNQEGFVLAARKLSSTAQGKGKNYEKAFSYCQRTIIAITAAEMTPLPALYAVSTQIYYHWRVRRQVVSGVNLISWDLLREFAEKVVGAPQYTDTPLFRYIYALALAHLGLWPAANALFAQLRQSNVPNHITWASRDMLLNDSGGIRWVQGVMRSGASRATLYVEDLKTDFFVERGGRWPKEGEIAHAAIQFSFGGATAIDRV